MGAYSRMTLVNDKSFDWEQLKEQWQAEHIISKIDLKMSPSSCASYCAYVFSALDPKPLLTVSTKFFYIQTPIHKLTMFGLNRLNTQSKTMCQEKAIARFLDKMGIEAPKPKFKKLGFLPLRLRLESVKWWTTKLRIKQTRSKEHLKIKSGLVRQYCSDDLLQALKEKNERTKQWLEQTELQHLDSGDSINLKQVHDSSLSNPTLRVCELKARAKGITEYFDGLGYRGLLVTTTASSSWHRLATKTDAKGNKHKVLNPKYNGASPKNVQNMFGKRFSYVRTWLSNRGIKIAGMRVAEPHQDGCTHWHFVLWFKNGFEAKLAIQAFRKYFLFYEGAPEKGALKHRLTFDTVNPKKGDVVGYVIKYITKGITGEHIDDHTDKNGEKIATGLEGAARVTAWARCWGIKQYQFFGVPPANIYRELRRVRCKEAMGRGKAQQITVPTFEQYQALQKFYKKNHIPLEMEELWHSSNLGDYGRYIRAYHDVQGKESVAFDNSCGFLQMACVVFNCFDAFKQNVIHSLNDFVSKMVKPKPKPKLLKHGFKEDLRGLTEYYRTLYTLHKRTDKTLNMSDADLVSNQDIEEMPSLNGYLEPKSLVYGVCVGMAKCLTRPFDGYFKNVWKMVTQAKKEQKASVQERIDAYAGVRGASGLDDGFWGDVVDFGAKHGAFAFERPKAA